MVGIGGVAPNHHRVLEGGGQPFGAVRVEFDELDVEVALDGGGEPGADVAATGYGHALEGPLHIAQFSHHGIDLSRRNDEENLIVRFN